MASSLKKKYELCTAMLIDSVSDDMVSPVAQCVATLTEVFTSAKKQFKDVESLQSKNPTCCAISFLLLRIMQSNFAINTLITPENENTASVNENTQTSLSINIRKAFEKMDLLDAMMDHLPHEIVVFPDRKPGQKKRKSSGEQSVHVKNQPKKARECQDLQYLASQALFEGRKKWRQIMGHEDDDEQNNTEQNNNIDPPNLRGRLYRLFLNSLFCNIHDEVKITEEG